MNARTWEGWFFTRQHGMITLLLAFLLAVMIALSAGPASVAAQAPTPTSTPGPFPEPSGRTTNLTIDVPQYEWLMNRWNRVKSVCSILVEHPGLPTLEEVARSCGSSQAEDWMDTVPCQSDPDTGAVQSCEGVYLHFVRETVVQKSIQVDLPMASAWISVSGCDPQPPDNRCGQPPLLRIVGEEPLPNESIVRVQGMINGTTFSCPGNECLLALPPTGRQGQNLTFWVDSSFGDSSPRYTALVRIMPWGDFMAPEGRRTDEQLWFVDVLSTQWRGERPASCADTWHALPEIGGPPAWLTTPKDPSELRSSFSYYYLAGMLIQNGMVNASNCPGGGLSMPQVANTCGVQAALPEVVAWQNRFDDEIMRASRDIGVPAQLLKNIFSRESQLWPGVYHLFKEAGLGQMSEKGADAVLLWNDAFFQQFCPLVLGQETCDKGFGNLNTDEQAILRGALVRKVNAACTDCPQGIDLTQAQSSVRIFAQTLLANCEQVAKTMENVAFRPAGELSSYEDLWRFTLVNYNAGPGCLARALNGARSAGLDLNWKNVSSMLEEGCRGAIQYVEDISRANGMEPTPTPTPWLVFAATPTPTPIPEETETFTEQTPMPAEEASATPTQGTAWPIYP